MPEAQVHFYSGTGNTARACDLIADALRSACHSVSLFPVTSANLESAIHNLQPSSLSVFAFPIYACGVPHIMHGYLTRLPRVHAVQAAVVCTMGDILIPRRDGRRTRIPGFEGHALAEAAAILRRRGYDVFFADAIPYPFNWTQVVNAPQPELRAELLDKGDKLAQACAARIVARERGIRRFGRLHLIWSFPFDRLYALLGRRRMCRLFVTDSDCNGCGACVRDCPTQAIRLVAGRPRWTLECAGCQRCINTCPRNAIQTSWLRVTAELVLTLLPLLPLILRLHNGHRASLFGAAVNPWVEVLLWALAYVMCFILADNLSWACEFVPGLRRLVRLNFTKRYRRYLEPHFRPWRSCGPLPQSRVPRTMS